MKQKISITLDRKTLDLIHGMIESGKFRNRSHLIEYSLKKFVDENSLKL